MLGVRTPFSGVDGMVRARAALFLALAGAALLSVTAQPMRGTERPNVLLISRLGGAGLGAPVDPSDQLGIHSPAYHSTTFRNGGYAQAINESGAM